MVTSYSKSNDLFKTKYADGIKHLMRSSAGSFQSIEFWLQFDVTDEEAEAFPNAKAAREIQQSPLYKAMQEEE